MEKFAIRMAARGQVALRSSLAYARDLNFNEPDERLARVAWGKATPVTGDGRVCFASEAGLVGDLLAHVRRKNLRSPTVLDGRRLLIRAEDSIYRHEREPAGR